MLDSVYVVSAYVTPILPILLRLILWICQRFQFVCCVFHHSSLSAMIAHSAIATTIMLIQTQFSFSKLKPIRLKSIEMPPIRLFDLFLFDLFGRSSLLK